MLAAGTDTLTLGRELSQKALDLVVGKNDARKRLASLQPVLKSKIQRIRVFPRFLTPAQNKAQKHLWGYRTIAADKAKITISASNQRLLGRQRSSKGGLMRRRKVSEPKPPRPARRLHLTDMSTERLVMIVFQVF